MQLDAEKFKKFISHTINNFLIKLVKNKTSFFEINLIEPRFHLY